VDALGMSLGMNWGSTEHFVPISEALGSLFA
jgi:hypothetical protein